MKRLLRGITIFFIVFFFAISSFAQSSSNSGTEFWTAYMAHNSGASKDGKGNDGGSLMSLYITSAVNTSGTITIADGSFPPILFSVKANQVTILTIPAVAYLSVDGLANKGIHIVSLKPIAIYAHIYAQKVSGATLLIPVSTLGKDYQSINFTQKSNAGTTNPAYSAFIVVATEDNTTVQITPKAQLLDGHASNVPFNLKLKKGQLYQGLSNTDLTGTAISSVNSATGGCTKVAVFSGSTKIGIGCDTSFVTSDNFFQQVYPTATWGKNYITVPLKTRNYDVFRIVLSNPTTSTDPNVTLNGTKISLVNFTNGYYEFPSQQPNIISSDQPIQVVQYAVSQDNTITCDAFIEDVGDPEMIYLNPLEQTINNVTLFSTGNYQIFRSFINVVIKTSAAPTFQVDGVPYTNFTTLPGNPAYSWAQISVLSGFQDVQVTTGTQGTHHLSASDSFNAIAYGFGLAESYGYAAGTNLQNLNENITLANPNDNTITQINGCIGAVYNLQLTLPFQTNNIVWDLKNGTTYTDNNPKVVSTIVKGTQTLYQYQYPKQVTYKIAGDTSVIATVFDPIAGACGSTETVTFNFNIATPPIASFATNGSCLSDSVVFTDKTNANGNFIKTWLWNFGDNTSSGLQNPKHLYTSPGSYKVTLLATNGNGCADNNTQTVIINQPPLASFNVSAADCVNQSVTFADKSISTNGTIVQWIWLYGDGKSDTLLNNKPVSHTYLNPGIDTVKLQVTSATGCISAPFIKVVTISAPPVVDFSLPAVCLSDTYAQFNDKSTTGNGSTGTLTYLWDFGDNTNSSLQNPKHKYSSASNYNVSLTVTAASGCSSTKTQTFTVNGDTPVADFAVENSTGLCSSEDVVFDDQSTVNFGNITKIVWYFDYNNHPVDTVVFLKNSMPANRQYFHNYGLFNSPQTKTFQVRMDVYSGITCVSTTEKSITVFANPTINISILGAICQSSGTVQIAEDKNGFIGNGVFSGPGVSSSGLFDPSKTGPGKFYIGYTFTTTNGCVYSTTQQVTVNPQPSISLISDQVLLEGGQVTLPAVADGDNLTYKWIPATGLDHDNILNPIASPTVSTTYKLIVTNAEGCVAAAQINVNVLNKLVVPNTFTPNGDGINDTWTIKYLDQYPDCTVSVFNRYGEKVYTSIGYPLPWDGKYNGNELPQGTYFYIINPGSGRKVISGNVTIIR